MNSSSVTPLGELEARQEALAERQLDVAALGDALGVGDGLLELREGRLHLVGAGDEEAVGVVLDAPLVVEGLARGDAHQHVVGAGVLAVDVVGVGGGHQRDALVLGELGQPGVDVELVLHPVGLDLEEEGVGLEDVAVLAGHAPGAVVIALPEEARDLAAQAGGQADQPLGVLAQQRLVDARVVVEALGEGLGGEQPEVGPALGVPGQQDEVAADPLGPVAAPLVAGDVGLHAEDGLHPGLPGLLVEVDGAEEVAVVGDRHRRHPLPLDRGEQVLDADGAVQQRVERVQVEMGEVGHGPWRRRRERPGS